MPKLSLYHLKFPHGLHVGRGGVESLEDSFEYVPSDTLFAALIDTWVYLGKDASELLPEKGPPIMKITSAFPYAGEVRFFPRPVDLRVLFSQSTLQREGGGKRLKKIRYISEKLFLKAAAGEDLDAYLFPEDEFEDPKEGNCLQGGVFWLLKEEEKSLPAAWQMPESARWTLRRRSIYSSQTIPRVTVDRINAAPNLFQSERIVFNEGCGLWFGVENPIPDFPSLLTALGECGLGGERTAGYGHFLWTQKDSLSLPESSDFAYLLSRWHPTADEIEFLGQKYSAYKLVSVGGWLRSSQPVAAQRRKQVWMIAEGSLIEGCPRGDAVDVAPEYEDQDKPGIYWRNLPHPVYRAGFAVAVAWKRRISDGEA
ncbi:MAG: type III-A CRISPR-associated RAMP protein Csm4 [Anaerolineales bacterium]|nr:type III-A CRISPR-associated RAMP protein Csm4 [Anaerolineales bacterium]MDW8161082.1 type III-A CRISPR-associated RAMP protein Csm4 [Anaerolineales bacterium]